MASISNRRSVMTLYSDPNDPYSHQVRIVLAEKGVAVDVINVDYRHLPDTLMELNPYGTLPTLVDRDLVLYESRIIMEYLDERFPHPPLMPVYPVARAECRRMMFRINRDWYQIYKDILNSDAEKAAELRQELRDTLTNIAPVFNSKAFFLSDEFTLVDCWLAPLLWRLPEMGIELPTSAKPVTNYMKRVFNRSSFKTSLTDIEREIRVPA